MQTSPRFYEGEGGEFFEDLDKTLVEEEEALERSKAFLEGLTIEEAEVAVEELKARLADVEHPQVEELVMGWERAILRTPVPDPESVLRPEVADTHL